MTSSGDGIQVDKGGFVRVHQTILELLATAPLRGQQFRCLMFLFRTTYGFNRKEHKISLSEWAKGTNMERHNVWRELQILLKCNVIYKKDNGPKRSMTWGFNKYHEQWSFGTVVEDDYKSVVASDDSLENSVVKDDYSFEESVVEDDYKSVVTPTHTRDLKDRKTTTTTTKSGSSGGGFDPLSLQHRRVMQCWRDNMTPLNQIIENDLKNLVNLHTAPEVIEAITIAVRADNKTMRYVKGVLNKARSPTLQSSMNGTTSYAGMTIERIEGENG